MQAARKEGFIPRLCSSEVRPGAYLALAAARIGDLRKEGGGHLGWPEVKIADLQMQSAP